MWKIIKTHIKDLNPNKVVFSVEISINLWQKLCAFLSDKGFTVLVEELLDAQTLDLEKQKVQTFGMIETKSSLIKF